MILMLLGYGKKIEVKGVVINPSPPTAVRIVDGF
jgi:hypothetical protein